MAHSSENLKISMESYKNLNSKDKERSSTMSIRREITIQIGVGDVL